VANPLLDGVILPTLLWLAWPNVVALSAGTCVVIEETAYIGRLGTASLAAMALVYPFVVLTMTMSGGAMGGGVSSAIARVLGAGDRERASSLAAHALLISMGFGLTFTVGMLAGGPMLLERLDGRGHVLAQAIAYVEIFFGGAVIPMARTIFSGRARVSPQIWRLAVRSDMAFDILRVGLVACFSPLQSVLSITIFTHLPARFGTETLAAYGIGSRLEFMLTSEAFAVGVASVPMIGMAIGAARIARARSIAWTAGGISFASVGVAGSFIAIFPDLWINLFTDDAGVRAASRQYLSTAAPMYGFIGLSVAMYFSSQGAAKVFGPVLAQSARLLFISAGGWWLTAHAASAAGLFALAAASMVVLGIFSSRECDLDRLGAGSRSGCVGTASGFVSAGPAKQS
jgi:Na+-driven multidrug efflux pump